MRMTGFWETRAQFILLLGLLGSFDLKGLVLCQDKGEPGYPCSTSSDCLSSYEATYNNSGGKEVSDLYPLTCLEVASFDKGESESYKVCTIPSPSSSDQNLKYYESYIVCGTVACPMDLGECRGSNCEQTELATVKGVSTIKDSRKSRGGIFGWNPFRNNGIGLKGTSLLTFFFPALPSILKFSAI